MSIIPQKPLLCGTYETSASSNQENLNRGRQLPIDNSRHENEPLRTYRSGFEKTLCGRDTENRARGRKRSRAESPVITTSSTKFPVAKADVEVDIDPSLPAESQISASHYVHGVDSPLHEIAYSNVRDKPNADVYFRSQSGITFSQRLQSASNASPKKAMDNGTESFSWSNAVCGLVIVLASHMWQFCKMNAFRGFCAGGGIGYVWKEKGDTTVTEKEGASLIASEKDAIQIDPGQRLLHHFEPPLSYFPTRDNINLHDERMMVAPSSPSAAEPKSAKGTPCHASKRQQVDNDGSWLATPHSPSGCNRNVARSSSRLETSSATRKRVRKARIAGGRHLRACSCWTSRSHSRSRLPSGQSDRMNSHYWKSDSSLDQLDNDHKYLSLNPGSSLRRRSVTPKRPSERWKSWQGQQHINRLSIDPRVVDDMTVTTAKSLQYTPVRTVHNTASADFNSVSQTRSRPDSALASGSPLSADARRYQIRQRREERRADASIRKVNDRLKDMIREGREALGSHVSVDIGISDEDW